MSIPDTPQASIWLLRIGYYRLSGYWFPFRERAPVPRITASASEQVLNTFKIGTELRHAFELYIFDKRLRLLFLDALERIEVALRVDVALLLGKNGAWAHRNPDNFNRHFRTIDEKDLVVRHLKWLSHLDSLAARSSEEFVKHYIHKYKDPLPIWIAVELWDFGTLSSLVNGMKDPDLQQLANKYLLPKRTMLISWLKCLNYVRNICAHHGRLWNKPLIVQAAPPRQGEMELHTHWSQNEHAKKRAYSAAAIVQHFLQIISPGSSWGERLKECLAHFPTDTGLDVVATGFPEAWAEEPLWATRTG